MEKNSNVAIFYEWKVNYVINYIKS